MKKSSRQLRETQPNSAAGESVRSSRRGECSLVSAIDLIWRVVCGRRYAVPEADIPDIAQEAILRLWKWRERFQERANGMTMAEWDSFTAKTAHNEINRYFSNRLRGNEIPLDDAALLSNRTPEGDADCEMFSLIRKVWQEICGLTLYQRRALLLGAPELVVYLIQFGVNEQAIVASLEISTEDWPDILKRLPLSDREIAAIARSSRMISDPEAAALAIGKARFDARTKLGRLRK
jgi:DNA-directed RNA polymerase specialized sigma24 family protein